MRREGAFVHSLWNGGGRRRGKYLRCLQALLLALTHGLQWWWWWYWTKRWCQRDEIIPKKREQQILPN